MDESQEKEREEHARLQAQKQRLLNRLASYTATAALSPPPEAVQSLFETFKNQRGEVDVDGFKELAWALGEDLTQAEALSCITRLDIDRSGGLSLMELQSWWTSAEQQSKKDDSTTATQSETAICKLLQRLRSTSYVQMLLGWSANLPNQSSEVKNDKVGDDHILRITVDGVVGDFTQTRSTIDAHFTNDMDIAVAASKELKAPENCIGILSFSFSVRDDIDEFELGELSGSLRNLLLLAKPVFKFHSHKTQMGKQNGSRILILSIFWDDIDELDQLRAALIGLDIRELEGAIELSQKPSDQTQEFVMGRIRGKLSVGVNIVPFLDELLFNHKRESFRAKINMLAAFRNLDLKVKLENMEQAYRRLSAHIPSIREVHGFNSLKQIITPLVFELYNDNSVPAPLKDTYFAAISTLVGLSSVHLQMDNQVLRLTMDSLDIAAIFPTKVELSSWKPPQSSTPVPSQNLRPLYGPNEYKFAIAGPPKVGKSSTVVQFSQGYFPDFIAWEDSYRKIIYLEDSSQAVVDVLDTSSDLSSIGFWVQSVDAVVLMYSVSDRASFNAMEDWRRRILQNRENLPIILLANKEDLRDERRVSTEEGEELARKWNDALFFEISALNRSYLDEAFLEAIHEIRTEEPANVEWYSASLYK